MMTFMLALWISFQAFPDPDPKEKDSVRAQDYLIGAGDVLSISVFGLREFDQVIRVSNSGKVHVPHLGVLKVHGLSLREVEAKIASGLKERELLKEPWVQVQVAEYRAHPVYILGEVQNPGQFLLTGEMRVLDLITLSGAFNEVFSPVGYLYRRKAPGSYSPNDSQAGESDQEAIKIDFAALYDESHPETNMLLQGGDILYVPERTRNYFFVVGEVGRPGAFELSFENPVLATQAIARAGGPLKTAKMKKGILMRYTEEGERQEKPVDFQAILRGKEPDFPILPNDIVFIPGSSAKTLAYGILNIIPAIALVP